MKLLYCTDPHGRGNNPVYRIGNFKEDLLAKFREVCSLAKKMLCNYIICGGDLFHNPVIALSVADEIVDIIEKNGIPFYTVMGNHDMVNCNIEASLNQSLLGHLFKRSKIIRHLETLEDDNTFIQGYDYSHGIEKQIEDGLLFTESKKKVKIVVPHALISEKSLHPSIMHIEAKKIDTNFDYILVSHYHAPYKTQKVGNTEIIAIGSLTRLTVGKSDLRDKVSVLFMDTDKNEKQVINLKSAKKVKDCFNLEAIEEKKDFNSGIEEFIESLTSTKFQGLDLRGRVEEIATKLEGDNVDVISEIIRRIEANE